MASRKIITGYTNETFNQGGNIMRAEFASIVVRALGLAKGTFHLNDKITREQVMAIIARAIEITKLDAVLLDRDITTLLGSYMGAANVLEYVWESIAVRLEIGIISGKGNEMLAPKDNMTRAEVAAILRRLLQKAGLI